MSVIPHTLPTRDPVVTLLAAGAVLAPATLFAAWTVAPAGMVASLAMFAVGLTLAATGMARHYPHARLGGANLVTTLRLALAAATASALMTTGGEGGWTAWAPASLAILALALDGVDGWMARRQALASSFGARFDMEVDSSLAAVLALVVMVRGDAGPELLVLGFARYAFVAAARVWPWLGAALPDSLRRKTVCVVQIATLVALVVPIFPEAMTRPAAMAAAALVAWSFARDIRWLARRA